MQGSTEDMDGEGEVDAEENLMSILLNIIHFVLECAFSVDVHIIYHI